MSVFSSLLGSLTSPEAVTPVGLLVIWARVEALHLKHRTVNKRLSKVEGISPGIARLTEQQMALTDLLQQLSNKMTAIEKVFAPAFKAYGAQLGQMVEDPEQREQALEHIAQLSEIGASLAGGPIAELGAAVAPFIAKAEELTKAEILVKRQADFAAAQAAKPSPAFSGPTSFSDREAKRKALQAQLDALVD